MPNTDYADNFEENNVPKKAKKENDAMIKFSIEELERLGH